MDKIIYVHACTYIITKIQLPAIKYTHPYNFIKTPTSINIYLVAKSQREYI